MSHFSPYGGFRWTEAENFHVDRETSPTASRWCTLEVDLEYAKSLYDVHTDYPLASERILPNNGIFSGYCLKIKNKFSVSDSSVENLVSHLNNELKYICLLSKLVVIYITWNEVSKDTWWLEIYSVTMIETTCSILYREEDYCEKWL